MQISVTEKNYASRNRKRQGEFRKRQLIEATIDCIARLGLSQTTLARIAERAGISQGNVVYHFHSMDELLEQALEHLSREYIDNWQQALAEADPQPRARLRALVGACFAARVFNRKKIGVWFAFWGESRSRPKYMRICGEHDAAFSTALVELCETLGAETGARLGPKTAALSIEGMIDGLWQTSLLGPAGLKRADAIAAVFELIDAIYPEQV